MIRAPQVLVFTIVLAACGGATDRAATGERSDAPLVPITRDSAGVLIHEHPADVNERAPLIALEPEPLMRFGGEGEVDLDLSKASGPLFLRDGGVAVFVDNTVRIYGADGNLVEVIGREGAGPQEFRRGMLAYGLGDTILVSDDNNARVALVVPGAGVVRTRSVTFSEGDALYAVAGQFGDDDFLLNNVGFALRMDVAPGAMELPIGRLRRGTDSIEVLTSVQGPVARSTTGGQPRMEQFGSWGRAVLWDDGVAIIPGDRWEINRLSADGRLVARVVAPRSREPLTAAVREANIESRITRLREVAQASANYGGDTTRSFGFIRDALYADSLPHFSTAQSTPGGTLWLSRPSLDPDSTLSYLAIAHDGRVLGRLEGFKHSPPVALGDDRVILRTEDDNGIVTWQVHRLIMPGDQ
jgi:hypothetical protein